MDAADVAAASSLRSEAAAEATARTNPLATDPVSSSAPPEAVIVSAAPEPTRDNAAATVPEPLMVPFVAPVPRVIPDVSVSVPPDIRMVPSVTFCAAPMVKEPAVISRV